MNKERYARQLSLEAIGPAGQQKLADARLVIVGCGGLGAIAAAYLAGAGVGYLLLIDGDQPQVSNLHRQVFFRTNEKQPKSTVLAKQLTALNPDIEIEVVTEYLSKKNIADHLENNPIDLVLECTDDALVKHMVSDFCTINELPLIYGAVHKNQGYLALFANKETTDSHLRDLFPEPDERLPTCAEVGVLNTAAGLIGLLQANEAIKWIIGIGKSLRNQLLTYDCLRMEQQIIQLGKTFVGDLEDIWDNSNYGQAPVADFLIVQEDLNRWPAESYQLISLLNEQQEPVLPTGVVRYHKQAVSAESDKKKVFYCKRGRQSKAVAEMLRSRGVEAYYLVR